MPAKIETKTHVYSTFHICWGAQAGLYYHDGIHKHDLQEKLGLTYLFIAHDLSVVKHISNRIAVMYLGKMVELAPSKELYRHAAHPYSVSLLSAVPMPDPEKARNAHRIVLEGDVPSPLNMPSGCSFRTRCRQATAKCAQECPALREIDPGHFVACHNV